MMYHDIDTDNTNVKIGDTILVFISERKAYYITEYFEEEHLMKNTSEVQYTSSNNFQHWVKTGQLVKYD